MKRSTILITVAFLLALKQTTLASFTYEINTEYKHGILTLVNGESLLVTGAGAFEIEAKDSSYIEVRNTTSPLQLDIGGIYVLYLQDYSSMNYYGGETASFRIYDDAEAIIRGGRIDYIRSYQYVLGDPHIEIICRDYTATSSLVTGTWNADNDHNGLWDTFSIQLLNQSGYSPVLSNIKFTVIPEPATMLLLSLGGLLIRRKK